MKENFDLKNNNIFFDSFVDRYKRNMFSNVTNGKYKYLSRIDNTLVYVDVDESYKDIVKDIMKEIGY